MQSKDEEEQLLKDINTARELASELMVGEKIRRKINRKISILEQRVKSASITKQTVVATQQNTKARKVKNRSKVAAKKQRSRDPYKPISQELRALIADLRTQDVERTKRKDRLFYLISLSIIPFYLSTYLVSVFQHTYFNLANMVVYTFTGLVLSIISYIILIAYYRVYIVYITRNYFQKIVTRLLHSPLGLVAHIQAYSLIFATSSFFVCSFVYFSYGIWLVTQSVVYISLSEFLIGLANNIIGITFTPGFAALSSFVTVLVVLINVISFLTRLSSRIWKML